MQKAKASRIAIMMTGIVGTLVLIFIAVGIALYVTLPSLCGNTILQEVSSPDGRYVATFFERDCGATTNFIRMVSLRFSHKDFSSDNPVLVLRDRPSLELRWIGSSRLYIKTDQCDPAAIQQKQWNDVNVICSDP